MKVQTQYYYEKIWTTTNEKDLLKIIGDEVGDSDLKGTLSYIENAIKNGKIITVGTCKFREEKYNG